MTVREMMDAVRLHREVKINGWTVKQDGHEYIALNMFGIVKCRGNAAEVHAFVRANK